MPRFLVELQSGAQPSTLQAQLMSLEGVEEATPSRTFNGLVMTATADAKQRVADQPGVERVYDDIQAVPQVADEKAVQDFLTRVREERGDDTAPLVETEPTEPTPRPDGGTVTLPELSTTEQYPENATPQFERVAQTLAISDAKELHGEGVTGEGVIMVVVDTGVCGDQFPESRRLSGRDFTDEGDPWSDYVGHGSMSAGIAAGGQQTDGASPGFAPGCDVYPVKSTLSAGEIIQTQDEILNLRERTGRPIVVNNSWGFTQCTGLCDHPVTKAVREASKAEGVYQVFAAGNQGAKCGTGCNETGISGPNSIPEGLAVAATGYDGNPQAMQPYSSRGGRQASCGNQKPDVSAPTFGDVPWGCGSRAIGNGGGTSAAAPAVAGAVALLLEMNGGTPPSEAVFDRIRTSANQFRGSGWNGCSGHGNLSAATAAKRSLPTPASAAGGDLLTLAGIGTVGGAAGYLLDGYVGF